jgi:xanthine dehydrogenase accessory factor
MREYLETLEAWVESGKKIAAATVISTWGSSPRPAGSQMFVNDQGEMVGSVSGGCVEGAVVESAQETLRSGQAQRLEFGVENQTAWEVGLACGGEIEVLVSVLPPGLLAAWETAGSPAQGVISVVLLGGPGQRAGSVVLLDGEGQLTWADDLPEEMIRRMADSARQTLPDLRNQPGVISTRQVISGDQRYFLRMEQAPLTLIAVGGVHIAVPLMKMARVLGFRTVVVDPRRMFSAEARFPEVDRLIQRWPQDAFQEIELNSRTAVAALTHDPKIDDPALQLALESSAFYVGALGSRNTQRKRRERLAELGLSSTELERIHGPIGLDLGGRSAAEIALAVLAEIVSTLYN